MSSNDWGFQDIATKFIKNTMGGVIDNIGNSLMFPSISSMCNIPQSAFESILKQEFVYCARGSYKNGHYYIMSKNGNTVGYLQKKLVMHSSHGRSDVLNKERRGSPEIPIMFVYSHGNGSMAENGVSVALSIFETHPNSLILLYEYECYCTDSDIVPSESSIIDSAAGISHIVSQIQFHEPTLKKRTVSVGFSMGTFAALCIYYKVGVSHVVLVAPFWSAGRCIYDSGDIVEKLWPHFINHTLIKGVECPIMFVHGELDSKIPPIHSQMLYDKCGSRSKKLLWLPEAGHENVMSSVGGWVSDVLGSSV